MSTREEHIALLETKLRRVVQAASETPARGSRTLVQELEDRRRREDPASFERHIAVSERAAEDDEMVAPLICAERGADEGEPTHAPPGGASVRATGAPAEDDGPRGSCRPCLRRVLARCMEALLSLLPTRERELRAVWKWARSTLAPAGGQARVESAAPAGAGRSDDANVT